MFFNRKKNRVQKADVKPYSEAKHVSYVKEFHKMQLDDAETYVSVDRNYIRPIKEAGLKITDAMIDAVKGGINFKYVADEASRSQQLSSVREAPSTLQYIENPTNTIIKAAINNAHGVDFLKKGFYTNEKVWKFAVVHDPELIRWCVDPTIEELALAIYCDEKYLWVAGDRKNEVMDYILNNDMTYMKNQFSI